jgi:hypothetical protein
MNSYSKNDFKVVVVLIINSLGAVPCYAGLSFGHDWSWSSVSKEGKYVFVVLFPEPIEELKARIRSRAEDPPYFTHTGQIAELLRLHNLYSRTGMYRNDGSCVPIWTTEEEVYDGAPSPDGKRLVHFDTDHFFNIDVYEASVPRRVLSDIEMMGLPSFCLQLAAGKGVADVDTYVPNATWDCVTLTWENGASTTIRLDDFAILKSNTFRYAFFNLFTTVQGIIVAIIFAVISFGLMYALTRWLMGVDRRTS